MQKDTEQTKHNAEVAQFRFALIAPVVQGLYPDASATAYYKRVTEKPLTLPDGSTVTYSYKTLEKWKSQYTIGGLDALMPNVRSDKGISRALNDEAINEIYRIKNDFPRMNATQIHEFLIRNSFIPATVSVDSVQRFIRHNDLKSARDPNPRERKAYEEDEFGKIWQADTCYLPYITEAGKSRRVYVIMIIDDHSRLLVGGELFYSDNACNFQKVLKDAIATYGIPDKLYVDNGCSYSNEQLSMICVSLGILLVHTKVRKDSTITIDYSRAGGWQLMYNSYYGLSFNPFNKQQLKEKDHFVSHDFTEMTNRLNYLKDIRGIGVFTARPGMGKSFCLRCFASGLNPSLFHMEYICLSTISVADFYKQLCAILGVSDKGGKTGMFRAIQEQIYYLYKEKRQPLLLAIDEAQYLGTGILNDIKMHGYDSVNCFTLILCGESHLNDTLRKPVHEALRQRITVHYNYAGLSDDEVAKYILHKLQLAGAASSIIDPAALAAVHSFTQGNPRLIDNLMTDALTIGSQQGRKVIDAETIRAAVDNQGLY